MGHRRVRDGTGPGCGWLGCGWPGRA